MKKYLMLFIIISLLLLDGCSAIGNRIGSSLDDKKEPRIIVAQDSNLIESESWIKIYVIDGNKIEGYYESTINDTITIVNRVNGNGMKYAKFSPSNSYRTTIISKDTIIYKIPLKNIIKIQIGKKGKAQLAGFMIGLVIDIIVYITYLRFI
jgi:hypothetical protein